jgi:hypothetical protein
LILYKKVLPSSDVRYVSALGNVKKLTGQAFLNISEKNIGIDGHCVYGKQFLPSSAPYAH